LQDESSFETTFFSGAKIVVSGSVWEVKVNQKRVLLTYWLPGTFEQGGPSLHFPYPMFFVVLVGRMEIFGIQIWTRKTDPTVF